MTSLFALTTLTLTLTQTPAPAQTPPQTSMKRDLLQAEIAISTLPDAKVREQVAARVLEHDSEVGRDETVTAIVRVNGCQADAQGCKTSADVIVYRPDGSVLSETKNVDLPNGRATVPVKLSAADVTGVYKVVARVRDLNARRFGTIERLFGVK
jgi:hypothetical protein